MPSPKRPISRLLLAWFAFVAGAVGYALIVGRRAVPASDPGDDELDLAVAFNELRFASTSGAFRGGRVTTTFGGGVLDLSGATMDGGHGGHGGVATLRLEAMFGGGQLIVPDGWRVESRVLGLFGGIGDGRHMGPLSDDAPALTLTGLALFGGWGVTGPLG
jgi:hypothetical protein